MNMFEKLSPMYSEIVALTLEVAPEDWTRLWLDIECMRGSWGVGGYWERESTEEVLFFEIPDEASDLVHEAWKVSQSYNDDWSTAIFRVDRPDKLQITFGHQDLYDESHDPSQTQAEFRAKTFGDRKIRSTIDMSGAFSLTPETLKAGVIGSSE
jgi:hypothetical protein